MGVVYKAEDIKLKRWVALKFLHLDLTRDNDAKERLIHEAQAASALDHPNIYTIYEIDETENGQLFIAMAYYEGETLKEQIERVKASSTGLQMIVATDIAVQIAQGLARAHEAGIVHRDIKPANIIVTKGGEVKIVDFGLAKLAGQTKITKTGTTMGTVAYMSPEQARGEAVDYRTDIWSFGVVMYEMLTGHLPFRGEYEQAVVYSIVNVEPQPITRLRADVPIEILHIVNKALAKNPADRYTTVADVLTNLCQFQKNIASPAPSRILASAMMAARSTKRWLWLGVLTVVIALTLTIFIFLNSNEQEPTSKRKMLAVLPFENLGLPEDEYFADGITEEITAQLVGIRELGIIARTSIIQYKNTNKTIQQIGKELGVEYILEGTVRWERNSSGLSRVRVTPQLIKVADATHIWANIYQKNMVEIFAVQSDIAEQLTQALNIVLLDSERRVLQTKTQPTDNIKAYDYYLRGNGYLNQDQFRIAQQLYEKAIELDSSFALAYARLSLTHSFIYFFYWDRTEDRLNKAKEAADKALQINPNLPLAHFALAKYYYWGRLDYERALEEYFIIQKLEPSNAGVWSSIGYIQRRQGIIEQALTSLIKAVELDPRSGELLHQLGWTYRIKRDYPEAIRYFDLSISLTTEKFELYLDKALTYLSWTGDKLAAWEVLKAGLAYKPAEWRLPRISDRQRWQVLRILGDYQELKDLYTLKCFGPDTISYWLSKAELYGRRDESHLSYAYYDSVRVNLEKKLKVLPKEAFYHSLLGVAYAGLGRKVDAKREGMLAVQLLPISKDALWGRVLLENLTWTNMLIGDYDTAIDQIESLLEIPGILSGHLLRVDPLWNPLHSHIRFQKLLKNGRNSHR